MLIYKRVSKQALSKFLDNILQNHTQIGYQLCLTNTIMTNEKIEIEFFDIHLGDTFIRLCGYL